MHASVPSEVKFGEWRHHFLLHAACACVLLLSINNDSLHLIIKMASNRTTRPPQPMIIALEPLQVRRACSVMTVCIDLIHGCMYMYIRTYQWKWWYSYDIRSVHQLCPWRLYSRTITFFPSNCQLSVEQHAFICSDLYIKWFKKHCFMLYIASHAAVIPTLLIVLSLPQVNCKQNCLSSEEALLQLVVSLWYRQG